MTSTSSSRKRLRPTCCAYANAFLRRKRDVLASFGYTRRRAAPDKRCRQRCRAAAISAAFNGQDTTSVTPALARLSASQLSTAVIVSNTGRCGAMPCNAAVRSSALVSGDKRPSTASRIALEIHDMLQSKRVRHRTRLARNRVLRGVPRHAGGAQRLVPPQVRSRRARVAGLSLDAAKHAASMRGNQTSKQLPIPTVLVTCNAPACCDTISPSQVPAHSPSHVS